MFSRANNQGIRRAKGRYIVLLNNDTIQIEDSLGKAVHHMDAHPDVGALGITHLNNDAQRSLQPSFERFFIYDEDIDWCFRAWRAGCKVRYWPSAKMVHIGSAARPFMKDKTFEQFRGASRDRPLAREMSCSLRSLRLRWRSAVASPSRDLIGGRVHVDGLELSATPLAALRHVVYADLR